MILDKKDMNEKLEEGYIHFTSIVEMIGKPKDHLRKTFKDFIKNLEENPNYDVVKKHISSYILYVSFSFRKGY